MAKTAIAKIYALQIERGIKTLEDVPAKLQDEVKAILVEDGYLVEE